MTVPASNLVFGTLLSIGLILTAKKSHDVWVMIRSFTAASYDDLSKAPFVDLHQLNPKDGKLDKNPYPKKIGVIMVNNWEFTPNETLSGDGRGYILKGWKIRPLDPFAREQGIMIDAWNDPHASQPESFGQAPFYHVRF